MNLPSRGRLRRSIMMVMGTRDRSSKSALPIPSRLVLAFIEHRHRDVGTLRGCLDDGDFETIARMGHSMQGSSPSYGFAELADLGERLEAAALARNVGEIKRETDELAAWLARAGPVAQRVSESGTHLRAPASLDEDSSCDARSLRACGQLPDGTRDR
jgi:HPt (histidine-containing phosphotransfer) domain-containing protein